jgi:hypothetical protein
MLSLLGKDQSYWVAPESLAGRYLRLLGLTDLGRTTYHYTPVKLSREKALQIDHALWTAMADASDDLVTKYSSVDLGGGVADRDLEHVLRSNDLQDTIHDLRFKFKDGRRRVYLILSRRKVQLKILAPPGDEAWKRKTKKRVDTILRRSPARFFKYILLPVPVVVIASIAMLGADYIDAKFATRMALTAVVLLSSWGSLPLFWMLNKGLYFTHAEITLGPQRGATEGRRWDLILSLLGPLIEVVKLIFKLYRSLRRSPRSCAPVVPVETAINTL